MPVKIRTINPADRGAIIDILRSTPAFTPEDISVAKEVIDTYLADPHDSGYHFCVAEHEGRVAAYICYGPTPITRGTWDVYWLATDPDQRGKGVGSTLLKFAEAHIKDTGGRLLLIETASNPAYESARRFYLANGYEVVSTIPDFYDPGDARLTFRKYLL